MGAQGKKDAFPNRPCYRLPRSPPWPPGLDRGQGASVRAEDRPRQVRGDQHLWRALRNKLKWESFRSKRTNTNPKKGPFHYRSPADLIRRSIRGMVPHKTARGAAAMERLTC